MVVAGIGWGRAMTVQRLIYWSQPFGFDEPMLAGILMQARRNNLRDGLTGALIVRADVYVQLLEGPNEAVDACFARIRRDNRHLAVTRVSSQLVEDRLFPQWTMRDDPAQSWMWTASEVVDGAMERASPAAFSAMFERLSTTAPV